MVDQAVIQEELKKIESIESDLVVIGAGGAGLRAAISALETGLSVTLICKSLLGKAHTVMAEGGAAAALADTDSRDSWQAHFRDTVRGSKHHCNWKMAELLAKHAPDRIRELEEWGAVFDRTEDGKISQRNFGGHKYPRLAHVGDRTGLELIRTLQDKVINYENLTVYMEYCATRILTDSQGRVAGIFGYKQEDGSFWIAPTKAIIIATGGIGKAYRVTSNSWEYTGDGISMALRAGAELLDMEFIQFHPTGMVYPRSVKGILVTEGVRGEGGVLLNNEGKRFMFNYIPPMFKADYAETEEEAERWVRGDITARRPPELLTRDVVSRAIMDEVKAGRGSPNHGAFLDIASRRDHDFILRKLPSMYHQFKTLAELDITKQPMEVGPTMHYIMGGIRVESETQSTNIPGLYAAGEVASGLHGANRLGGNSLSDLLVLGALAGDHATNYVQSLEGIKLHFEEEQLAEAIEFTLTPFDESYTEDPYKIHQELQEIMEEHVGIRREEDSLKEGIRKLERLQERALLAKAPNGRRFNPGWHLALSLHSMIDTSLAIAQAALNRKESRGAHTRLDFTSSKPELENQLVLITMDNDGNYLIKYDEYPLMPKELRKIIEEEIE